MPAKTPVLITLLTDFGTRDPFVASMKGVILSIHPQARILDLTHDIEPQDVAGASFFLAEAARWFPKGTIHVAVVDPGVGSSRRSIVAESGGQIFIGPDNGLLPLAADARVRELVNPRWRLPRVSSTFHGRDLFAPAAGQLSRGASFHQAGPLVTGWFQRSRPEPYQTGSRMWSAEILHVDRFGNLITNLRRERFPQFDDRSWHLQVGMEEITRMAAYYAELEPGELALIPGSSGYLEVCANQASAARRLGVAAGSPVELVFAKPNA
jgi:S-adenosylmethionine hydrolase